MTFRTKRIFIIDDHPVVAASLAQLIDSEPGWRFAGAASNCPQALAAMSKGVPDAIILEPAVDTMDGLARIADLAARAPVLCLSVLSEQHLAERALRAGARGFLMKTSGTDEVRSGLRGLLAGDIVLSERTRQVLLGRAVTGHPTSHAGALHQLNDRELRIVHLIGAHRNSREIARHLCLSEKTVATHRHRIREKLQLRKPGDLARLAAQWVEHEVLS